MSVRHRGTGTACQQRSTALYELSIIITTFASMFVRRYLCKNSWNIVFLWESSLVGDTFFFTNLLLFYCNGPVYKPIYQTFIYSFIHQLQQIIESNTVLNFFSTLFIDCWPEQINSKAITNAIKALIKHVWYKLSYIKLNMIAKSSMHALSKKLECMKLKWNGNILYLTNNFWVL